MTWKQARSEVHAGGTGAFRLALLMAALLPLGGCKVVASRLRIAFGIPAPRTPFLALKPPSTNGWQQVAAGRVTLLLPPTRDNETLYATLDGIELGRREMLSLSFEQIWAEHHEGIEDGEGDIQPPHRLLKLYDPPPGHEKTEVTALFEENPGNGPQDVLEHWQQFGKVVFWGRARFPPVALSDTERRMSEVFGNLRVDAAPGAGDFAFYEAAVHLPPSAHESLMAFWDASLPVENNSTPLTVRVAVNDTTPAGSPDEASAAPNPHESVDLSPWTVLRKPTPAVCAGRAGMQTILLLKTGTVDQASDAGPDSESYSASWNSNVRAADTAGPASSFGFDTSSYYHLDRAIVSAYWDQMSSTLSRR